MHLTAHLDLDVLAHESDNQLSVLVELQAPELSTDHDRAPSTLVVVLDRSGSMAGDRIEGAKTALLALVDRLDPRDRFGLVAFDGQVEVVVPAGPLTDKPAVKQAIAGVYDRGATDLSGGYFRGLQEAKRVAGAAGATVLLISDGHANAGICDPGQLGDVARKAHADGITTTTLGVGLGFDERLLSALAAGGAGNELFAETADEAVQHIAGEVEGLLSLAAQAGSLLVRMSPLVRAVRIVNELPSVAVSDGSLVELGSFYAGETRKLVLTFDVPGIAALGLAEVASLEFTYVALPALEQHTVTVPLHVNVVPGDEAAGRIPNPTVRTELAFQQAQRAKREASSALSAGDTATAASALRIARRLVQDARAEAPPELLAELYDELAVLGRLEEESRYGDVARAAKLSSMDSAHKSRTHGRHHGHEGH
jgi:Ca-activated chloride channel family protein